MVTMCVMIFLLFSKQLGGPWTNTKTCPRAPFYILLFVSMLGRSSSAYHAPIVHGVCDGPVHSFLCQLSIAWMNPKTDDFLLYCSVQLQLSHTKKISHTRCLDPRVSIQKMGDSLSRKGRQAVLVTYSYQRIKGEFLPGGFYCSSAGVSTKRSQLQSPQQSWQPRTSSIHLVSLHCFLE